jgi:hypothetical protein
VARVQEWYSSNRIHFLSYLLTYLTLDKPKNVDNFGNNNYIDNDDYIDTFLNFQDRSYFHR